MCQRANNPFNPSRMSTVSEYNRREESVNKSDRHSTSHQAAARLLAAHYGPGHARNQRAPCTVWASSRVELSFFCLYGWRHTYLVHPLSSFLSPRQILAEAARILRPGGSLAIMEMDPSAPGYIKLRKNPVSSRAVCGVIYLSYGELTDVSTFPMFGFEMQHHRGGAPWYP